MNSNRPLMVILALVPLIAATGCDRPAGSSTSAGRGAASSEPARPTAAQFTPITQLPPGRTVHIAVDPIGNVFYTVETEKHQDGVIVAGTASIPRATYLTSANILAAMGETVGGSGTIQDIIAGPDGAIWFYFIGGKGRTIRACIGQFVLRDEKIHIAAGTDQLKRATAMGDSIELARGSLLPAESGRLGLFVRHSDAWTIFRFDARSIPAPGTEMAPARCFEKLVDDATGLELDLTRQKYELSGGPDGGLLMLDRTSGELWQIDPSNGRARVRNYLAGLPQDLSEPLVLKREEPQLLFFAAESDRIAAGVNDILNPRLPRAAYPALVRVSGKDLGAIGRDDLRVPTGFPGYAMRIPKLVQAPDGSMVGYDSSSGQIMRIRWVAGRG
jgi:hypothetical protein